MTMSYEERIMVLRDKAADIGAALPIEVADYLASRSDNPNDLKSSLINVASFARQRKRPVSIQLAQFYLDGVRPEGGIEALPTEITTRELLGSADAPAGISQVAPPVEPSGVGRLGEQSGGGRLGEQSGVGRRLMEESGRGRRPVEQSGGGRSVEQAGVGQPVERPRPRAGRSAPPAIPEDEALFATMELPLLTPDYDPEPAATQAQLPVEPPRSSQASQVSRPEPEPEPVQPGFSSFQSEVEWASDPSEFDGEPPQLDEPPEFEFRRPSESRDPAPSTGQSTQPGNAPADTVTGQSIRPGNDPAPGTGQSIRPGNDPVGRADPVAERPENAPVERFQRSKGEPVEPPAPTSGVATDLHQNTGRNAPGTGQSIRSGNDPVGRDDLGAPLSGATPTPAASAAHPPAPAPTPATPVPTTALVQFAPIRSERKRSMLDRIRLALKRAGIEETISEGDKVAIKVHFGEQGNTAFVSSIYTREVVRLVKELGARPFVTDANTLYSGMRDNAIDHIQCALENGFAYATIGAPIIIADGLDGHDATEVRINGRHFDTVKIGSAAVEADAMVVISHVKGHEAAGFGGALKNIGMGLGCRSAKQRMHSGVKPEVQPGACINCGKCISWCPQHCIEARLTADGKRASWIDSERCIGCGECVAVCAYGAIEINWASDPESFLERMVEHAAGALANKRDKTIFLSFMTNISPDCDCFALSDAPIVSDIGVLAARDAVAIDQAAYDLVTRAAGLPGSRGEGSAAGEDTFRHVHGIDGAHAMDYAERLGLGTRLYELKKVG